MAQLIKVGVPVVNNVADHFKKWVRLESKRLEALTALAEAERDAGYAMLAERYPAGTKIYRRNSTYRGTTYIEYEVLPEWEVRANRYYKTFVAQPRLRVMPLKKDGTEAKNRKRAWVTLGEDGELNPRSTYERWTLTPERE